MPAQDCADQEESRMRIAAPLFAKTVAIAMAFLFGLAMGIAGSLDNALLGRWQASDKPWHIEFQANGIIYMSTIGPAKRRTYRLDSSDIVWINMEGGGGFKAAVSMPNANVMILTDADRSFTQFRKVP
jgi:hypothetical protein